MNFREVDRKLCIIRDCGFVRALDPEQETRANAVLFCGYIDHSRGLTYEAMGLVRCEGVGWTLVSDVLDAGLKVRADTVEPERVQPIADKALEERFRSRIEKLAAYYKNEYVVETRALEEFDPYRDPQHPDDICALFLTPENRLERMWVRAEAAVRREDGMLLLVGRLLNESDSIPDLNIGAAATLTVIETKCGKLCVGAPGLFRPTGERVYL